MGFGNEKFDANRISRRQFLKTGLKGVALATGSLLIPSVLSDLGKSKKSENNRERNEKPPIVKRADWDKKKEISEQYKKRIGEEFVLNINGKEKKRIVNVLPYYKNENFELKELKDVYQRIVLHHTAFNMKIDSHSEAIYIRDFQINTRGFNDIAYHFMIAENGEIFEGRPIDRIGSHAGATVEEKEYKQKHFPKGIGSLSSLDGNEYLEKLRQLINAGKMDPDYGSLGIVLFGNFQKNNNPTKKQEESLIKLLNYVKGEYDMPTNNIIYHNEVKEKVVEASGLHLVSPRTNCPGGNFTNKAHLEKDLKEDTENSKVKSLLLEKSS